MRLTCPNCGAEYDVPEGLVPPAGRHVQCTACHTRWFMRGRAREELSEDEILSKLDTRGTRAPVSDETLASESETPAPIPFPRAAKPTPVEAAPSEEEPSDESEDEPEIPKKLPAPSFKSDPVPAPRAEPKRAAGEAAPGVVNLRPAVGPEAGAAVPAAQPLAPPVPAKTLTPPPRDEHRSAARPRIDVAEAHAALPPPPRRKRRFLPGFILALLIGGLAFEVYFWRDPLAAQLPAAAPALQGYTDGVDAAREWLRDRFEQAGLAKPG